MGDLADFDWLAAQVAGRQPLCGPEVWDEVPRAFVALRDPETYPEDWDGGGAYPPDQKCVTGMAAFLAQLNVFGFPPPYCVYPASDGTILAEWAFDYPGESFVRVVADVDYWDYGKADVMVSFGGQYQILHKSISI